MTFQEALKHIITNPGRKIQGAELNGWCGLEGEGWIWDLENGGALVLDLGSNTLGWYLFDDADTFTFWTLNPVQAQM